jgi:predicted permease
MAWADNVRSDVRYAARVLVRRPLFTTVAALTLALGVATSTAMFTLVNGVVLRPLPYAHPERLVEVMQSFPEKKLDRWTLSQENAATYMSVKSFDAFAAYARTGLTLDNDGANPDRIIAELVTGDFFSLLGVKAQYGRVLGREDDQKGMNDGVVLSYAFWQTRFGGAKDVIGRTIQISGQPARVVGVMPQGFGFPKPDVQLYTALALDPSRAHPNFLTGLARLRAGVSVDQASQEATRAMWDWARRSAGVLAGLPAERTHMRVLVTPLHTAIAGNVVKPLVILQSAVLLILLIAIANIATLISARGVARRGELALRSALGANRGRLVAQLVTESLMLAAVGGAAGVAGAVVLVRTFTHSSLATLPRIGEVGVDVRVLGFAVCVTALAGLSLGVLPALSLRTAGLRSSLGNLKSSAGRGSRSAGNVLVAAQVSLSFVLLIGAGLLLKSFVRLMDTELGFDPRRVTSVTIPLPMGRYGRPNNLAFPFVNQIVADVSSQPGVNSAAVMFPAMYVNDVNSDGFLVEGQDPNAPVLQTVQYAVSPGLFHTLRIPLLAGRDLSTSDRDDSPPVVVVDEALIAGRWKPADAVGKRIRMTGDTTWRTVVGVVGSIRDEGVADASRPHTYFPFPQYGGSRPTLVVRSDAEPTAVVATVRRALGAIDPAVPIDAPHPITAAISGSLVTRRLTALLLAGFAALAMLLAACGLYGVMALRVESRRREFGIRAAIGARPAALVRAVVSEALALVIAGVGVGVLASLATSRGMRSLLYDVAPTDSVVYVAVAGVFVIITGVASYLPARRAARSDPLLALRSD